MSNEKNRVFTSLIPCFKVKVKVKGQGQGQRSTFRRADVDSRVSAECRKEKKESLPG